MNCFICTEECPMQTEQNMDKTPCMVCVRGDKPADNVCRECMGDEKICNFEERNHDRGV